MKIKTFRAKSIQQALELVRRELGPDASVLHTRRVNAGLLSRVLHGVQVEVAATASSDKQATPQSKPLPSDVPPVEDVAFDHRERFRQQLNTAGIELTQPNNDEQPVEPFVESSPRPSSTQPSSSHPASSSQPTALFDAFTALIEAEIDEPICRDLIDRVRATAVGEELSSPETLRERLRTFLAAEFTTSGAIEPMPGERKTVALVGPTGVGKTTTLAKLAANFRLSKKLKVGLITVDTYRVAAVEQLRTYADIIDLPMEVVATPREMRSAIEKFADYDLVLLDTAGRSPRDAVKVQELRSILAEAKPDEVHLVLSTTASSKSLQNTARQFAEVGVTSLLLTKLDEASGLGNVLALARSCPLPFSYTTNGQNVPDDIAVAESQRLAESVLPDELLKAAPHQAMTHEGWL